MNSRFFRAREGLWARCPSAALISLLMLGSPGWMSAANLCLNPGFESPEETFIFGYPGVPSSYGDWGGDLSQIVSTGNGIVPRDGTGMLRFDATGNSVDILLTTGQVYQLVDLSSQAALVSSGMAVANLEAWFNRVDFDSQTDTAFSVSIFALDGDPSLFQGKLATSGYLDRQSGGVITDDDPATWEPASASMQVPAATTYLAIQLIASENVLNDGTVPEFDGHYADSVMLGLVPEPSVWMMGAAGGILTMLGTRRRPA